MRPELVTQWRAWLPYPFNKPSRTPQHSATLDDCNRSRVRDRNLPFTWQGGRRQRRNSSLGALEGSDRSVSWLRYMSARSNERCEDQAKSAVEKLRRVFPDTETALYSLNQKYTSTQCKLRSRSIGGTTLVAATQDYENPTIQEVAALAAGCFANIESSPVVITEFSETFLRVSHYTLEEVLASEYLLNPPLLKTAVRWIFVEYDKIGTFWGSGERCFQWGTDPALFEKSPIELLKDRMAALDKAAGRAPLEDEDWKGYKRVGKYYREQPGCPEFIGLRVDPSPWIMQEKCQLLLKYLERNPEIVQALGTRAGNDVMYGLQYLKAREELLASSCEANDGYRKILNMFRTNGEHFLGSWDDHVERLEFYRPDTLLSSGSKRLYTVVADLLESRNDALRKYSDTAFLYYKLARVSIENDEMMQDGPERALNKLFATMKNNRRIDHGYVTSVFDLRQAVLDGLEYLEENKRELPIWGIPPFQNQQVRFHPDHTPPAYIQEVINREMDLVDESFRKIIGHWCSLKDKVERHLDVLIQFRVLDQQDLAVKQRELAAEQLNIAAIEAKNSRLQSRSVVLFTALTIVFMPLSFFTSYFGMNVTDIRETKQVSRLFWAVCGPISACIILAVFGLVRYMRPTKNDDIEAAAGHKDKTWESEKCDERNMDEERRWPILLDRWRKAISPQQWKLKNS